MQDVRVGDERVIGNGPSMTVTSCFAYTSAETMATSVTMAWYDTTHALKTWVIPAQTLFLATRAVNPQATWEWEWSECGSGRNREGTASSNGVLVMRITDVDIDHGHCVFVWFNPDMSKTSSNGLHYLDEFDLFEDALDSANGFLSKHRHLLSAQRPPDPHHDEKVDETPNDD